MPCIWVSAACWTAGQLAPYLHLARTFDLVEKEKGKIKTTAIFCNMFRRFLNVYFLIVLYILLIIHRICSLLREMVDSLPSGMQFASLSPDDVLPAVYLCTNKISPDHENMVSTQIPYFIYFPDLIYI